MRTSAKYEPIWNNQRRNNLGKAQQNSVTKQELKGVEEKQRETFKCLWVGNE